MNFKNIQIKKFLNNNNKNKNNNKFLNPYQMFILQGRKLLIYTRSDRIILFSIHL